MAPDLLDAQGFCRADWRLDRAPSDHHLERAGGLVHRAATGPRRSSASFSVAASTAPVSLESTPAARTSSFKAKNQESTTVRRAPPGASAVMRRLQSRR
jgi:hypothetical protein